MSNNGVALLDDTVRKYGVTKNFPPQVREAAATERSILRS